MKRIDLSTLGVIGAVCVAYALLASVIGNTYYQHVLTIVAIFAVIVFPFFYNIVLSFSNMSLANFRDWQLSGPENYIAVLRDPVKNPRRVAKGASPLLTLPSTRTSEISRRRVLSLSRSTSSES